MGPGLAAYAVLRMLIAGISASIFLAVTCLTSSHWLAVGLAAALSNEPQAGSLAQEVSFSSMNEPK